MKPAGEPREHKVLGRVARDERDRMHRTLLSDAVDASRFAAPDVPDSMAARS